MKSSLKLAIVLTIWSVIACSALALVNSFTAPIIEMYTKQKITKALSEIFPDGKSNADILSEVTSDKKTIKFDNAFLVKSDNETLGVVITATGPTFNSATIMVGVQVDGRIKTIKFINLTDSKGIGTKVLQAPFASQFDGKDTSDEFKVRADVQNISTATVSSKGVTEIVKTISKASLKYLQDNSLLIKEVK